MVCTIRKILARLLALCLSRSQFLAVLITLLCLLAPPAFAKTYTDNGDGTVTDPTTGLQWMRCSMGQTWDGSTCSGTAGSYTWDQAVALTGTLSFAGQSDWRLPNIRELHTIVDRSAYGTEIDATVFPNTLASMFWSASAVPFYSNRAWVVTFSSGGVGFGLKTAAAPVRLVRAGQFLGILDLARPALDYVDHGDGTVTHTPTGLMWKRCAEGQSWDGATCMGTASTYTWGAAQLLTSAFAGNIDWHMPTLEELVTLVDFTSYDPAVNSAIFPSAPASIFWSASAAAGNADSALAVNFYGGSAGGYGKNNDGQVRLVRAGQSLGPSTSTTTTTASTTTTTLSSGGAEALKLVSGWNLVGNSRDTPLDVASAFGDASKVITVWKWIAEGAKWAFYAPSLIGQTLTDYAAAKGYDVLSTVFAGEGFWVNAKAPLTVQLPTGADVSSFSFQRMPTGWNLVATGDNQAPSAFNTMLSGTISSTGATPLNLTSLWAWDNPQSNWYFYAPSLEASGGLADYSAQKGYLNFGTRTLSPATGFWVNRPSANAPLVIASQTSNTVDSAGGIVTVDMPNLVAKTITLEIPPGALAAGTVISMATATNCPPTPSSMAPVICLKMEPSGTIFLKPVKITIPYDDSFSGDINEFVPLFYNEASSQWEEAGMGIDGLDTNNKTVTITALHFSPVQVARFLLTNTVADNFFSTNLLQDPNDKGLVAQASLRFPIKTVGLKFTEPYANALDMLLRTCGKPGPIFVYKLSLKKRVFTESSG